MARAKNGSLTKIGSYGRNWIFGPKTEILGPRKGPTFGDLPCSGHNWKKLFKEKSAFAQIIKGGNIILVIFWGKPILRPKTTFWPNVKNALFSAIPAQTGSVVLLGHFLDGPDGSTQFR